MTRRRILAALAALAAVAVVCVIDAFAIEPSWPKLVRVEAELAGLTSPLTIALLADVHTKEIGRLETRVLAMLEREKPDAILLAGDLVHNQGRPKDVAPFLRELSAPLGTWVVPGNWDYWRGGRDAGLAEYGRAGAHVLRDEIVVLREDVVLAGLDDTLGGDPDPAAVLALATGGQAVLVLMHEPGLFPRIAGNAQLALAGHTHGGQGRLPFIGALHTPPGSGDFVDGWYESRGSRMYVSRGIGTSVIAARFWCRPEVTLLTLRSPS